MTQCPREYLYCPRGDHMRELVHPCRCMSLDAMASTTSCGIGMSMLCNTRFVRTLRRFDRALVCVYVMQFLSTYSYFILSAVLVQYLSANLHLNDVQASLAYTAFGIAISITGIVFGLMVDQLSVFAAVMAGAGVALLAKLLFLFVVPLAAGDPAWTIGWSTVVLMTLLPLGETAMAQSIGIGIKRYAPHVDDDGVSSDGTSRAAAHSIEYSLSYSLQNVAALLAYASISMVRAAIGPELAKNESVVNLAVIGLSLPVLVLTMGMSLLGMRWDTYDIDAASAKREDELLVDDSLANEDREEGRLTGCAALWERMRPRWMSRLFIAGDTGTLFARYLVVSLGLTGAKSLFRHLEATLPKYAQREFDPSYDYALLMLVNPAMVIVLTTFVQALLARFDTLKVIIGGTVLCSAGASLFMVEHPVAAYVAVVVFTLGEIVWSPRFTDYVYQLAPLGQEGAFGSVATMPLFLAKIPVGLMSGYLLETYCPAFGTCQGVPLWGSIAAFSATAPLILALAYRWVVAYTPSVYQDPERLVVALDAMISSSHSPHPGSVFVSPKSHTRRGSISDGANGTPRRPESSLSKR